MDSGRCSIDPEEINQMWYKARNQLVETQVESEESLKALSKVRQELDGCQRSRLRLKFVMNCLINQVGFFKDVILDKSISQELIDNEWSKSVLTTTVRDLNHWQQEISNKTRILQETRYELSDEYNDLGEFICEDHIEILKQKIDEIPTIKKQVANLRHHYASIKNRIEIQLEAGKLQTLRKQFELHFNGSNGLFDLLEGRFFADLNHYENELADYLQSVTQHFDKCTVLKEEKLPDKDLQELLEVVRNDHLELEEIRGLIFEAGLEIKSFCQEVYQTVTKIREHIELFRNTASKIILELEKYEEYLSVFQNIARLVSMYKDSCTRKIKQVQDLCEFYDKFKRGYTNLLKERDRRQLLANKMEKILRECDSKLRALNEHDLEQRQQFLLENGDYLPENIWPGKIDDMNPLYSMDYSTRMNETSQ